MLNQLRLYLCAIPNFGNPNRCALIIHRCKIYDLKNEDGLIKFKYKFKYKKDYDVHLKIEDDIVATYTVKVTE